MTESRPHIKDVRPSTTRMGALAIDIRFALDKQRQVQSAADAAAFSGPTTPGGRSNGTAQSYRHSNSGLQTLSPGVWCNGVSFTNDAQIKWNPGVHYVNRGNFNVGGAVNMTGTGVTIISTGSGNTFANATIGNGAAVTLSAPTTGTTQGLVLVGDPNAPSSTPSSFFGAGR
jgi:hypothetical protein